MLGKETTSSRPTDAVKSPAAAKLPRRSEAALILVERTRAQAVRAKAATPAATRRVAFKGRERGGSAQ